MRPLVSAITRFLSGIISSGWQPANFGAEQLQFFFDTFVAAVDVIDTVDYRFVFTHEASNDQAGRRTQVCRHNGSTLQYRDAAENYGVAFYFQICAHPVHFMYMHEAIFKYRFGN